jgi:glutathione synthase/RimK-type ligase-like ATP-grasp enzyme
MTTTHELDVVILTEDRYESGEGSDWFTIQHMREEQFLIAALNERGLRTRRVAWSSLEFDWNRTRAAVFRSTWDYFERFPEFVSWVDRTASCTLLINSPELVRWNWDKHYLLDLEHRDIRTPATVFLEPGAGPALPELLATAGWPRAVLKPAVSATGRHTYLVNSANAGEHDKLFRELRVREAMLLQEFQEGVLTGGELSVIAIGGKVTHAVRKLPRQGEFRVHDDHGGTVHAHTPSQDEVSFAERAVAACGSVPAYARVDVVRDLDGGLVLMELELIEPELFFRFCPSSAAALAEEVAIRLV